MAPRGTRKDKPSAAGDLGRAGRPRRPAVRSVAVARSRTGRSAPAARSRARCAPQYAGGGTGSWRPRMSCGNTRRPQRGQLPSRTLAAITDPCQRRPGTQGWNPGSAPIPHSGLIPGRVPAADAAACQAVPKPGRPYPVVRPGTAPRKCPAAGNAVLRRRSQGPLDAVLALDASTFSLRL